MKLINANNLLLPKGIHYALIMVISISIILSVTGCTRKTEFELLQGNWAYVSVSRGDSSVMEVNGDDLFYLRPDSTFEYHIASVNKRMQGRWIYTGDTLHLAYSEPDTIRYFAVDRISEYNLNMHEGQTQFVFHRVR